MGSEKVFSMYTVSYDALASGTSTTKTFQVNKEYKFTIIKLTYSANIANAGVTQSSIIVPSTVSIQITDTGTRYDWSDNPIPIPALFGTGQIPFILPTPYVLSGNSSLSLLADNTDAANTYNIDLCFIGYVEINKS